MASTVTNTESSSRPDDSCQSCHRASCEPALVAITAINPARKFTLDLSKPLPEGEYQYVLRVLAKSDEPRLVEITLKGNCKQGHGGKSSSSEDYKRKYRPNRDRLCPSVEISASDLQVDQPSPVKVQLLPPMFDPDSKGFRKFLEKYLIPINLNNASVYNVTSQTCSGTGKQKAQIEVFQQASWGGEVGFGYEQPKYAMLAKNEKVGFEKMKGHGKFFVSGKLNLAVNTEKWEISGKLSRENDKPFEGLTRLLKKIEPFFSDLDANKETLLVDAKRKLFSNNDKRPPQVTIHWPNIAFGGEMKTIELPQSNLIDLEGKFFLKCPTLIGADVKVDILGWILRVAAPGYSVFLDKIRERLKQGVGNETNNAKADLGVDLKISGKVSGKFEWTKSPNKDWTTDGTLSSNLEFVIEGFVTVEVDTFLIKISAGAGARLGSEKSAKTGVGFTGTVKAKNIQEKPGFEGTLAFTGAAIYYTLYIKAGAEKAESDDRNDKSSALPRKTYGRAKTKVEAEKKHEEFHKLVTLIKPFQWPEKAGDVAIDAKTI
ncbi:MAG: hypothetical protein OEZ43_06615 [Gammaproteobacteria bacterium]|nr:hypothetical protein [Gammaproteobacteria bacterium]